MTTIEELFVVEADSWLKTLPDYQVKIINQLYLSKQDYNEVAQIWLSASMASTAPFGAEKRPSVFYEKVLDEIEAFFTGDKKYEDCRLSIIKESGAFQSFAVGVISVALSPFLGASAIFLAPVISIVLFVITKVGLNAWLGMRKEQKETERKDK